MFSEDKLLKDVILICKNYYNKNKYKSKFEALKGYYIEFYDDDPKLKLNKEFLYCNLLKQAMFQLCICYSDRCSDFIINSLLDYNDYTVSDKNRINENKGKSYTDNMFDRCIKAFHDIKISQNGSKKIDIFQYHDYDDIIK